MAKSSHDNVRNTARMSTTALLVGILCIVLAAIVLIFANGLRRWYSGILFAIVGTVMLANAVRWRGVTDGQDPSS